MCNIFSKKTISVLISVYALLFSGASSALTICSLNCPPSSDQPAGNSFPQLLGISSIEGLGLHLSLETSGLIILDSFVYENLYDLTIGSNTSIYLGEDRLPENISLDEPFELITLEMSGHIGIEGHTDDFLLYQLHETSSLNLSSSNGILVLDYVNMTAAPLPGSFLLMSSGIVVFALTALRKKKSNNCLHRNRSPSCEACGKYGVRV